MEALHDGDRAQGQGGEDQQQAWGERGQGRIHQPVTTIAHRRVCVHMCVCVRLLFPGDQTFQLWELPHSGILTGAYVQPCICSSFRQALRYPFGLSIPQPPLSTGGVPQRRHIT